MNNLTDLQLVENYQKAGDSKTWNEIYNRYRHYMRKQSGKLNRKFRGDSSLDFEDHEQEVKISLLRVVRAIDPKKVKDRKTFKLALSLKYSISNYENVLNRSHRNIELASLDLEDILEDTMVYKKHRKRLLDKCNKRSQEMMEYDMGQYKEIIQKFEKLLSRNEFKIFKMFMGGKNQKDIASRCEVTPANISYFMNIIRKKYKKFCKESELN
jgi:hypothetical protein